MSDGLDLSSLSAANIFNLRGVVAVVTGGGSGIGLSISSTLATNGAHVYIVGPNQAALDNTADIYNKALENVSSAGRLYGLEGDVREKAEAKRLAGIIEEREGHLTILFNNAGISSGQFTRPDDSAPASEYVKNYFDNVTPDQFDNNLRTNAFGPYWLTFAFLPLLEKWKNSEDVRTKRFVPQVIMTSSMNGWTKDPATAGFSFPYIFSKSAVGHATSTLAHELLPLGVRVNAIAPGWFATEMTFPGEFKPDGTIDADRVKARPAPFDVPTVPTGGTRRDIGSVALMLVVNHFMNGETVLVDGGTMLKHPSSY